uniref:DUF4220 domain-containing protein n=1 Tax=Quercus lobata TaxID=97700 RepID=A0A7N2LM31_QUELO
MKGRQMMDVFNLDWRKIWKEWELRGLVILSLTCQIILITLGKRRKYIAGSWIGIIVWSTYLLADYIAAMAISILSNDLGDVYRFRGSLDEQFALKAFWGPFLLMHLGGTDSISAFSVEDNELWRRHALGVLSQALITAYVLLTAWTNSRLSLLSIPIFCIGLVKYSERVWVLYSSSKKKFRNSIPTTSFSDSNVTEQCNLKQLEGYNLTHQVLEFEVSENPAIIETQVVKSISDASKLLTAYNFLDMVKGLFADVLLGVHDRDASKEIFEHNNMNAGDAFKIIEIELSYIYDLMYTKAEVVYSIWGIVSRIIWIFLILSVLVMLLPLMQKQQRYSKIEYYITLVLLVVALLLELSAIASLLYSDRTAHWLITHYKTTILKILEYFSPLAKRRRWSDSLKLLSFSPKEEVLHQILKKLRIDKILEIHQYGTPTKFSEGLKKFIFDEIKQFRPRERNIGNATVLEASFGRRGGRMLERFNRHIELEWSVKLGFDESIIIWHLATKIICSDTEEYSDSEEYSNLEEYSYPGGGYKNVSKRKICEQLSQYMLYLLVEHPYMLRIGIGQIRFQDVHADVRNFIKGGTKDARIASIKKETTRGGSKSNFLIVKACKLAFAIKNPPKEDSGNKTNEDQESETKKREHWDMIANVWLEMLGHAAGLCEATNHARQLSKGGELLTHVWLLMAHLGLTDHFQIERSPSIVAAVAG